MQTSRQMALSLDNNLPSTVLRFGSNDENEVAFSVHYDRYASMNTANELLHIWIITLYPEIVVSYELYDDANSFHTITLDCDVSTSNSLKEVENLIAVIVYKRDTMKNIVR